MKVVLFGSLALVVAIMLARPLHMNLLGRRPDRRLRLPVRDRVVAADRRDRLVVEPDLRHDRGDAAAHLPGLPAGRLDRAGATTSPRSRSAPSSASPSSNGGTTSQDLKTGFLVGATPRNQQIAILIGALVSALVLGPILLKLNDAATVYVPRISKEPVAGGAGDGAARRREFPGGAARRSVDADRARRRIKARRISSGTRPTTDGGPAGQVPGRRRAARRSSWSTRASTARISYAPDGSARSRSSTRPRRR